MNRNLIKTIAGAACLMLSASASADSFTLETEEATGTLNLALDAGTVAELKWTGGPTDTVTFDGSIMAIAQKAKKVTVKTTTPITMVVCQNSKLTKCNFRNSADLTDLNLQDNALTSVLYAPNPKIEYLNVAGNPEIGSGVKVNMPNLRTLICAGNGLTEVPDSAKAKNITTLWCQNNEIAKGDFDWFPNLETVHASHNKLTTLSLPEGIKAIHVDHNELVRLQLADYSQLHTIVADNCKLTMIRMHNEVKRNLKTYYSHNNELTPRYLTTVYDAASDSNIVERWSVAPQAPIELDYGADLTSTINFSASIRTNFDNKPLNPVVAWFDGEGKPLTAGTDYEELSVGKYKFLRVVGPAYAEITSPEYPDAKFKTSTILIVEDLSSISEVAAPSSDLKVAVDGSALILSCSKPTQVTIAAINGTTVFAGTINGTWQASLAAGVYLVNNTKVIVGK